IPDLGLFPHFPWCRKLCPYCDFAVEVGEPAHDEYFRAILRELVRRADRFRGNRLVSIYFGGGTPSRWRVDCVAATIEELRGRFGRPREITLEANPVDCTPQNLLRWRLAGATRLWMGVQSFRQRDLVVLGRDHRFGDGRTAIAGALASGFIPSADFTLGVPAGPAAPPIVDTSVDHL